MDKTADPKQNKTDKHNSQKKDPDPYGKMAKAWIRIIKPMTIIPCLEIGLPVILM